MSRQNAKCILCHIEFPWKRFGISSILSIGSQNSMNRTGILTIVFLVVAGMLKAAALQQTAVVQQSLASGARSAKLLPGTRADVLSTVQGNALSSANGQLAGVSVRLRDARTGRIVDTQFADKAGSFAFKAVDPGTYIVEI